MPDDGYVTVGRVGPARGVRGEVFVEPRTDAPQDRFTPGAVLRCDGTAPPALTVAAASLAGGRLVVRFDGIHDREAAEALRGTELSVLAADRPPLDDPETFYDTDLVGLTARLVDGAELGAVTAVSHAGGTTCLVVDVDGVGRLVPFVLPIVPSVDVAAGTVTIDPPDGLLDL